MSARVTISLADGEVVAVHELPDHLLDQMDGFGSAPTADQWASMVADVRVALMRARAASRLTEGLAR